MILPVERANELEITPTGVVISQANWVDLYFVDDKDRLAVIAAVMEYALAGEEPGLPWHLMDAFEEVVERLSVVVD